MKNDNDDNKVILNEQLQDCLNEVGESPFDEPKIFEAIDSESPKKTKAVKIALARKDLDINDYDGLEIANFFNLMRNKIIGLKLEDGTYKTTDATKNYRFPNFEEVEKFGEFGEELNELYQKQRNTTDDDDVSKIGEALKKLLTKMDKLMWKVTDLDKNKLTAWEVQLISEQIFTYTQNVQNTSMGKPLSI